MPLASVSFGDFGRTGLSPNAMQSVPFQRRTDPDQLSSLLSLEQHEIQRIKRYMESWNFYYGRQWAFTRSDGEPLVTLNYTRKMIDKSVTFLMGKGLTVNVHEALEQVTRPFIDKVWKDNAAANLLFEMGIMGGVTGDVFLLFTYEEPTALQRRINPYAKGRVRINLLGSEQVFPTWDPLDITRMVSVRIETVVMNPDLRAVQGADISQLGSEAPGHFRYTQIITPDIIIKKDWKGPEITTKNVLGEIPLVHIKNLSLPNEYYGLPDTQDLIDLQRELNEKSTDISDTVNYHAAPITVVTGAKAKQLDKGPKKIWSGLPANARVELLEYQGNMQISQTYWDRIKKAFHEISDVPENSLGGQMAVSNTSGVALQMLYRPLIEKTDKKKATYIPGLERGNYFILRLGQMANLIHLEFDLCESCGGRIVEHEVSVPNVDGKINTKTKRDCYQIDPRTLAFLDPMEMRVKYKRNYLEGSQYRETEYWKILAMERGVDTSFWQPDVTNEDKEGTDAPPETRDPADFQPDPIPGQLIQSNPAPTPSKRAFEVGKFGSGTGVDLPEEPESVVIIQMRYDPNTGLPVPGSENRQSRMLIPTGCTINEYLNPFDTEVTFGDPLPRDEKLAADLFQQYLNMKVVSKKWVQRQIPDVAKDMTLINQELDEEGDTTPVPPPGPVKQPELKGPEDIQAENENAQTVEDEFEINDNPSNE